METLFTPTPTDTELRKRQGLRLLNALRERGVKQRELCDHLGMAPARMSLIIHGRARMSEREKVTIAQALDLNVDELWRGVQLDREDAVVDELKSMIESRPFRTFIRSYLQGSV